MAVVQTAIIAHLPYFTVSTGRLPTHIGQLRIVREHFACQR